MAQVMGTVKVRVDGQLLRTKPGAKLDTGGTEREPVVGYQVYGYKEKQIPSTLTFAVALTPDMDIIGFAANVDSSVEFEGDNGLSYLCTNMFVSKPGVATDGEGWADFEMQGDAATNLNPISSG